MLIRLQYNLNITFICTEKPKSSWDLLYCGIRFSEWSVTESTLFPRNAFNSESNLRKVTPRWGQEHYQEPLCHLCGPPQSKVPFFGQIWTLASSLSIAFFCTLHEWNHTVCMYSCIFFYFVKLILHVAVVLSHCCYKIVS